MLQIRFGKLEHAHRVTARRLVGMLHRVWASPTFRQRKRLAAVPIRHIWVPGRRAQGINAAVTPVDKNIVELHLSNAAKNLAGMRKLRKPGIGRIRRAVQIKSSIEDEWVADIAIRIDL